jgi:hypothetical protein
LLISGNHCPDGWEGLVKGQESQETSLDTKVTGLRGKVEVLFCPQGSFEKALGIFFMTRMIANKKSRGSMVLNFVGTNRASKQ